MTLNTDAAKSGGAGLALGVVLVFIVGAATGLDIPAEVGAAVGTLSTFILGLFIPPTPEGNQPGGNQPGGNQ